MAAVRDNPLGWPGLAPDSERHRGLQVRRHVRNAVRAALRQGAIIPNEMTIELTAEQRTAATTVGRSLIVSAAAGSGKTAVLAQRCAYLVCDAPEIDRCAIDQLLVLTFTDAAAAEMRSRIADTLRERLRARPHDQRLREQVALVGAAQISTIHAYCLWLVRRWFTELGVDAAATLLDADEATLLKREVIDELFDRLYAEATPRDDAVLGTVAGDVEADEASSTGAGADLARQLACLVDDYGLGEDHGVREFVLRLSEFVSSLPEPDTWLLEAREQVCTSPGDVVLALLDDLAVQLRWQLDHCQQLATMIEAGDPIGSVFATGIRNYEAALKAWYEMLPDESGSADARLAAYESIRQQLAAHEMESIRSPRLAKDADPAVATARDRAKGKFREVKEKLFDGRLRSRFALFSREERLADLEATGPYVTAVTALVSAFREAYADRKQRMAVLDFSDLERLAYELLRSQDGSAQPSEPAAALHGRFDYVLVDEFQDINPLQQEIIRLSSREPDPKRADNLFAVGDVKQSIYRFRLAEPKIFTDRLGAFRDPGAAGLAVTLQKNFRSRSVVLDAVNLLFAQLMREGAGDVVYDDEAELRPGRDVEEGTSRHPVEVHLLERHWGGDGDDDAQPEPGLTEFDNPARWAPIEREAYLIGKRVRGWVTAADETLTGKPLRYRDIVILVRAAKVNAQRMAGVLTAMGVPAYAAVGGTLFGAMEVRDALAALDVLDNPRQDIPLAAVLRSGILADPLSEDELVALRCIDREIPFHEAVFRFAESGTDPALREKLNRVLSRVTKLRDAVRRRPLAEALWSLYERHGYLAGVEGMRNGPQRRANLLKLYEVARTFGTFRRQGLHRFLRFIELLQAEGQDLSVAPAIGESEDVVRIMTIHQSKGLEFPVVFVAGLGTRFNLGDRSGNMIFERHAKIGLRVIDSERMIEYPTAAHQRAADEIERYAREEELRVLYVAMTRARDKLVLVGSSRGAQDAIEEAAARPVGAKPSLWSIATAATPLDWLLPALGSAPPGTVNGLGAATNRQPTYEVRAYEPQGMAEWSVDAARSDANRATLAAAAAGKPLPADEPLSPGDGEVEEVLARVDHLYPHLGVTSVRAAVGAGEFKGAFDFTHNEEQRRDLPEPIGGPDAPPRVEGEGTRDGAGDAAERGTATHRALQHIDFAAAVGADGVACELQRLTDAGVLTRDQCALVDLDSLAWFVTTPLAEAIRKAGKAYHREFPYIATEPPSFFDLTVGATPDDRVLVRGIVDGILADGDGLRIIDFKTDRVGFDEAPQRAERYRSQMAMYARAMARLWRRQVDDCSLVFLTARRVVAVPEVICGPDGDALSSAV